MSATHETEFRAGAERIAAACEASPPILVQLHPFQAVVLIGLLQLALRHPRNASGEVSAIGRQIADTLINSFPADVKALLDRGFDPAHDDRSPPAAPPADDLLQSDPQAGDTLIVRSVLERVFKPHLHWWIARVELSNARIVDLSHTGDAVCFAVDGATVYQLSLRPIAAQLADKVPMRIGTAD